MRQDLTMRHDNTIHHITRQCDGTLRYGTLLHQTMRLDGIKRYLTLRLDMTSSSAQDNATGHDGTLFHRTSPDNATIRNFTSPNNAT